MKRVLVTGSTGFTARYVKPLLAEAGDEVWGVSRRGGPGERELAADITDPRAIAEAVARARPTHVLHLAGTSNLPDSEAGTLYRVNVEGTKNLLDACAALREPPQRIVLASSGYVYGDTGDTPATEDRAPKPVGEYGKSKLEMERVAAAWVGRLPVLVARPFNYTGVGHDERFVMPKLVRAIRERRRHIDFIDPGIVRDFSDVRWLSKVYARLLDCELDVTVVNVCSGHPISLGELVDMLAVLGGYRPERVSIVDRSIARVRVLVGSAARCRALGIALGFVPLECTMRWILHAACDNRCG